MFTSETMTSSLMMLAGISLACWVMLRLSLKRRKKTAQFARDKKSPPPVAASRLGAKGNHVEPPTRTFPLGDAPPEVQRWQVAMFDLARELKAEVDTRVMTLAQLSQRVDSQIQHLESLIANYESAKVSSCTPENEPSTDDNPNNTVALTEYSVD